MIFEIHCTCSKEKFNPDEFKKDCATIGTKAVQVILDGLSYTHSMTSSTINVPSVQCAYTEAQRISDQMISLGYDVQRIKIETTPDYYSVPKNESDIFPEGCYFESHVKVQVQDGYYDSLKEHLNSEWHLSSNAYKKESLESTVYMCTYRKYTGTYSEFKNTVENFISSNDNIDGIKFDSKYITEFAIYDSNVHMDDEWLRK